VKKWDLGVEDEVYGFYLDTIAAADDVYSQVTGCSEWDTLDISNISDNVPRDISQWERIKKER
jgi:hypothetical protein